MRVIGCLCVIVSLCLLMGCTLRPNEVARLTFVLTQYGAGPAVEGASVFVWNEDQELIGQSLTDEQGRALVGITQLPERIRVSFSKFGYAISVIEGLSTSVAQEQITEAIMRKAELFLDPSTQENFPQHTFNWYYQPEFWGDDPILIDPSKPITDDFVVEVQICDTQNHLYAILPPVLGRTPSEPTLSKDFLEPIRNAFFKEFEISIKGHSTNTDLNLVFYDYNGNRYHRIVYLDIQPEGGPTQLPEHAYQPISATTAGFPNLISFTRRMGRDFLSQPRQSDQRGSPQLGNLLVGLFCVDYQTALQRNWISEEVSPPEGYRFYRSFDNETWESIGFLSSEKANGRLGWPDNSFYLEAPGRFFSTSAMFVDISGCLEAEKEVFYAVACVYGTHETPKTFLRSIIPLESFSTRLINPYYQQVQIFRQTEFQFGPQEPLYSAMGNVQYTYRLFLYDQVQDQNRWIVPVGAYQQDQPNYGALIETSDSSPCSIRFTGNTMNEELIWYSYFDGQRDVLFELYPWDRLEAHKTYSWSVNLAFARVSNSDESAVSFSIGADYHPYKGSMGFDPCNYGIQPDWMFEFTTGTH